MNVCQPMKTGELLSYRNRLLKNALAVGVIFLLTFVDAFHRYNQGDWKCDKAPVFGSVQDNWQRLANSCITGIIFSCIPTIWSMYYYAKIIKVLIERPKRIGRNLNLIMAFGVSSLIFGLSFLVKFGHVVFSLYFENYVSVRNHGNYPLHANQFSKEFLGAVPTVVSITNPFIFLLVVKSYRKPFMKAFSKKTNKNEA